MRATCLCLQEEERDEKIKMKDVREKLERDLSPDPTRVAVVVCVPSLGVQRNLAEDSGLPFRK